MLTTARTALCVPARARRHYARLAPGQLPKVQTSSSLLTCSKAEGGPRRRASASLSPATLFNALWTLDTLVSRDYTRDPRLHRFASLPRPAPLSSNALIAPTGRPSFTRSSAQHPLLGTARSPLPQTMSPPRLPPELISDILDTFLVLSPSHALRTPNLARFARVNHTWNAAAIPLLYRNIYLDSRTREGVLDAFEANPDLPKRVRHLTLSGGKLDAEGFKRLLDVLRACTDVTRFSYHCFDPSFLEDLTDFVAAQWPGLRYLRADQSHALYSLLARLPDLETLIASYIEFHAPGVPASPPARVLTPSPPSSGRSSPSPSSHPVRPTFRLKRFDSGSSPHPSHFHLLTSSSTSTLTSLDLPISSQTSQDLEAFKGLKRLTLTLAERYIRPLPGLVGGREDAHCLRRVKRLLAHAGRSGVPLRTLEIYEPSYALTTPFAPSVFEETDVLAAVPKGVEELDFATLDIGCGYIKRAFEREGEDKVCEGVRLVTLARGKREEQGAEEMRSVLGRRGVEVRWA
ncbi:hypothetical protein OF846_003207 [Rhodotorula toruloides]|nr:hypothetical protein OF846_003207 [Rhodotorula toruloides]